MDENGHIQFKSIDFQEITQTLPIVLKPVFDAKYDDFVCVSETLQPIHLNEKFPNKVLEELFPGIQINNVQPFYEEPLTPDEDIKISPVCSQTNPERKFQNKKSLFAIIKEINNIINKIEHEIVQSHDVKIDLFDIAWNVISEFDYTIPYVFDDTEYSKCYKL